MKTGEIEKIIDDLVKEVNSPLAKKWATVGFRAGIKIAKEYHNQKLEEIMPELFDWIIIFVQKARVVDDPRLDRLFELDDLYQKVYSDNRIRHDFFIAAQMAYMAVFNEIFKSFLKQEEK